jgi:hypothetical protein
VNHGCVTLDEVFAAASARAASLVPETSGYLALAVGDATSRLPLLHDDRTLLLTTEGSMSASRRGDVVAPERAARAMRDVLARLLAVSSGTMPGLAAAARPREESARGVDAVIEEIEAALIPVNRAAARRALARLSRETLRAKEAGKLKPRREASVRPPPPPPPIAAAVVIAPAPPPPPPEPAAHAVFSEPPPLAPRVEAAVADTKQPVLEAPIAACVEQPVDLEREREAQEAELAAQIAELNARSAVLEAKIADLDAHYADLDAHFVDADPSAAIPAAQPLLLATLPIIPVAPAIVAAASPTSEEAVTVVPEEQIVVAYTAPIVATPSPAPRFASKGLNEPTPTTLGMAIEIDEAETPFTTMALVHATVLGAAAPVEEAMSVAIHAPVYEIPVILAPALAKPVTTRADDLLATFAVSCSDAASMREATDGLKKLAGLEPTPPPMAIAPPTPIAASAPIAPEPRLIARAATPQPPIVAAQRIARAIPAVPPPAPKPQPALEALHSELEEEGQAPRRRARPGISVAAALLAGAVVGLLAVTRLRPDLVTSFEERVSPAAGVDRAAATPAPARAR